KTWNAHWISLKKRRSFIGNFLELFRKQIISRAVSFYFDKYFGKEGTFIEAGSGSSQTSLRIKKLKRKIIAVDISEEALKEAKKVKIVDETKLADIRKMPFKKNSIDGVWNLGVMEHFEEKEDVKIIDQFYELLKKDGKVILFWPPDYALYRSITVPFEFVMKTLFGRKDFVVFPNEINRIHSKTHLMSILKKTKFKKYKIHFNARDAYTHYVVVLFK
ncbi:MAG: class I SAM-dependent methyltransferase, partial [Nanoarchaeota archaeon]|nr:class I SAM-dependent methyltransferase [Nanoarchaeota archaeon]